MSELHLATEGLGPELLDGDTPHEECGIFGVYAPGEDVARLTFFGLFASAPRLVRFERGARSPARGE